MGSNSSYFLHLKKDGLCFLKRAEILFLGSCYQKLVLTKHSWIVYVWRGGGGRRKTQETERIKSQSTQPFILHFFNLGKKWKNFSRMKSSEMAEKDLMTKTGLQWKICKKRS